MEEGIYFMFIMEDSVIFKNVLGEEKVIKYFLSERNFDNFSVYGFRLEKLSIENKIEEASEVLDFTEDEIFAKDVFFKIRDGIVTPITLVDVLDNFLTLYEE